MPASTSHKKKSSVVATGVNSAAKQARVALVHDYLREYGGAERVLEALHELYPEAPVYVGFFDREALGIHAKRFDGWDIRETWIARIPFYKKLFSPYRVFAPNAFKALDLSGYDVVLSSSNAYFAKAVTTSTATKQALHLCYCHTPARSLYGYTTMSDWKRNPITRFLGTILNHYLRVVDYQVAQGPLSFIANSYETKRRIEKFYRRDAEVIFPPVTIATCSPKQLTERTQRTGEYYLYVGRLTASKHVDLAVEACTALDLPLMVVGVGKGEGYLRSKAGVTVTFLGAVSDAKLHEVYAQAKALIFPAEDEDFGIVPIEAMGHGVPVIAHRSGGPRETIVEGVTGLFFDELTAESLQNALKQFQKTAKTFDSTAIYTHALGFRTERFQQEIAAFVAKKSAQKAKNV